MHTSYFGIFRYGPGPRYYIELKITFDPESNVYDEQLATSEDLNTIILETASANLMPHSIFLFLEMVTHGVYNGAPFHRNAVHLVQAGPGVAATTEKEPSLQNVIYQEFSSEFPHEKYTVGFPGRPGGPDFYINMRDNSHLHGPGGQIHHYGDIVPDADPCFARILKGQSVIERIHKSETVSSGHHAAVLHPATIRTMTVLKDHALIDEA